MYNGVLVRLRETGRLLEEEMQRVKVGVLASSWHLECVECGRAHRCLGRGRKRPLMDDATA